MSSDDRSIRTQHNRLVKALPKLLARLGILDEKRGTEAFSLAWPVILTGGLRVGLRLTDFLMVGFAIGAAGVAALGFGFQFFFIGFALSLAVSSGTISLVSQHHGAGEYEKADFVIKQSVWLAVLISLPLMLVTWFHAEGMIGLLSSDPEVIDLGGAYLRVLMIGLLFRFFSMVAARAFAGSGNTVTPMYVSALGVPSNVVLNWLLIFGIGVFPELGIVGAALGTLITNISMAVIFFALLFSNNYNVSFKLRGKQWDTSVVKKLFSVSLPLLGMRMARTLGQFPFLWMLDSFGTGVVAAYQVGRRVELFAMEPAWGFGTASSTLVGQSLGAEKEDEAELYGWDTLKISIAVMLPIGFLLALFAGPISGLFSDETDVIFLSTRFIYINAIGVLGYAVNRIMRGALRGAGDTRWPFYGNLLGIYGWLLPVSYIFGIVLDFGLIAIFIAVLGSFFIPGLVNLIRFKSGRWKEVSRKLREVE
ncbi:MAG: MATE family efflux transporter [Candidatus Thermoplasmatota archaeon]|nr:MATE family efflux transporter [Candidatus Thermoplasmatota archaeon]MBS3789649.1 MATE family efflux transporter [Candidatus Thermoplasmatota archaeon]